MVYEAGVKFIADLTSAYVEAIRGAVNKIVDAFQAFVAWAVDFICDAFSALIAQPLQALYAGLENWANGLVSLVTAAAFSIENGTDNASASFPIFQYILASEVFKILTVIGISLFAVITAASFLGPLGFIASLVAPFLVNILVSGMTAAAFAVAGVADISSWVLSTLVDVLGDDLVGGMAGVMGATIGTIGWIAETMMLDTVFDAIKGFVWSSIGAIISWVGAMVTDWTQSLILDLVGLALALKGCYEIFVNPNLILRANPTALSIMKGVTAIETGISIFELTTTVASHE